MNFVITSSFNKLSAFSQLLQPSFSPCVTILRQKSRRSTRLKRAAIKARIKAIKASAPKQPGKLSFMLRLHKELMKGRLSEQSGSATSSKQSGCLSWPSRLLQVDKPTKTEDDVFRISASNYLLSLSEAVSMLRKLYDRTAYDCPMSPVTMRLDLNMNADLEGKEYVESTKKMIVLPYPFEFGKRRVVMAFCKNLDAQLAAREAGAEYAGDALTIRNIRKGIFKVDDVDYFVAHVELVNELGTIRGLLRDKMPTQLNGMLGVDVVPLVKHFRNAVTAEVKRDDSKLQWGMCTMTIGNLQMTNEELEANASFAIKKICELRPQAFSLGHFIHRAAFVAHDLKAFFPWRFEMYAPKIPENDSALIALSEQEAGKKGKKKKKRL